jgi:hypothetical protein
MEPCHLFVCSISDIIQGSDAFTIQLLEFFKKHCGSGYFLADFVVLAHSSAAKTTSEKKLTRGIFFER